MKLTLIDRKAEAPGVESFIFKSAETLSWKAGQFLRYTLPHEPSDDRGISRWFTISSAPFEQVVMLTTRFSEKGSTFKEALRGLQIGDAVEASSATGNFVIDGVDAAYVFIAGGIGITPFRALLQEARHEGKMVSATLLYANRDKHIVFKEELETLQKDNPNLKIRYVISPRHIDADMIKRLIPNVQHPLFYISGPEPMVTSTGEMLQTLDVPANHIKQDWFLGYPSE